MKHRPSQDRKYRQRRRNIREPAAIIREKFAVAELARELAHELNNPLEALTNLLYLARSIPDTTQVPAMLQDAEDQLARVSTIVRTILTLEKVDQEERLRAAGRLLDATAFRRFKQEYESALHLASIVEGAQDAIYSKKLDGTIMAWNAEAERLFGYSPAEVLGKSIRMLIPREKSREEREILNKLRSSERMQHFETVRTTKKGRVIRVSVSISPIRSTSGRVVGAATIAREIRE